MNELTTVQNIAVWALPILFAITLHEVAHGWVASLFGDQTARLMGRLSLNPIKHVDPVGTVLVPLVLLVTTQFIFGWAKPVPVDSRHFAHPRRQMALVALAGPLSNLLMALLWGLIAKMGFLLEDLDTIWQANPLIYMGMAGIQINVMLAVLNFIPLPPLDGGNILSGFLPKRMAYQFNRIQPYGFIILILLMFSGALFYIMAPFISFLMGFITGLYGI